MPLWVLPSSGEGSSPLTRGKHSDAQMRVDLEGLIPAHAGKTVVWGDSCPRMRAHPRSRGENVAKGVARALGEGSSPLTRGKLRGVAQMRSSVTAHPRSRGENPRSNASPALMGGSSPLTRGKQALAASATPGTRLIPAHAGKTAGSARRRAGDRAHPRSRGENPAHLSKPARPGGSSPLTRGKRSPVYPAGHARGLIPAHAGKTPTSGRA